MNCAAGDGARDAAQEDIAIVGMACIFPRADTPAQFWQNIVRRVDCVSEAPSGWSLDRTGPAQVSEPIYTAKGCFLGDLCRFDPIKYGVMPASVEGAEPDQFLALRCAFEALADAGIPELPLPRDKTGIILGRGIYHNRGSLSLFQHGVVIDQVVDLLREIEPHRSEADLMTIRSELKRQLPPFQAETVPGLVPCLLTGRIANRLDLKGPAYYLDAACAAMLPTLPRAVPARNARGRAPGRSCTPARGLLQAHGKGKRFVGGCKVRLQGENQALEKMGQSQLGVLAQRRVQFH